MIAVEHVAGPAAARQLCARCGYVLQDVTQSDYDGGTGDGRGLGAWKEGARVIVRGGESCIREYWTGGPAVACAPARVLH